MHRPLAATAIAAVAALLIGASTRAGAGPARRVRAAPRRTRAQGHRRRLRRPRRGEPGAGLHVVLPVAGLPLPHRLQGVRRDAPHDEEGERRAVDALRAGEESGTGSVERTAQRTGRRSRADRPNDAPLLDLRRRARFGAEREHDAHPPRRPLRREATRSTATTPSCAPCARSTPDSRSRRPTRSSPRCVGPRARPSWS